MADLQTRGNSVLPNIVDAVGWTPCVRLNKVPQEYGLKCEVVAKCEFLNPAGSVKDRIGRQMVIDAEASGRIKKGDTLVEATSGNTGVGMSMTAAALGYNMVITMPVKMSHEKQVVLESLGARVIRTPNVAFDHPDSLISVARRMAATEPNTHLLDQYTNPSNWESHYHHTGEEIYQQCGGRIDMIIIAAGTGGTMTGVAKKLKEKLPHVIVVAADPVGSILADPANPGPSQPYQVEGIGYDFVPVVCHRQYVDKWVKTDDAASFELARKLQRREGLLVGGSSGSAMQAVIAAAKDLRADQRCVVLFADNIRNYLTKFVDDGWMQEKGFFPAVAGTRPTYDALVARNKELEAELERLRNEAAKKPSA